MNKPTTHTGRYSADWEAAVAVQRCRIDCTPAERCPDYDSECVDVTDPYLCWSGVFTSLPQADGYCPMWIYRGMNHDE